MEPRFSCLAEPVDLTETFDDGLLIELASSVVYALEQEGMEGDWEVAIVLTTDAHVTDLHAEFMNIAEAD